MIRAHFDSILAGPRPARTMVSSEASRAYSRSANARHVDIPACGAKTEIVLIAGRLNFAAINPVLRLIHSRFNDSERASKRSCWFDPGSVTTKRRHDLISPANCLSYCGIAFSCSKYS
jgi:hypothetical protein